jgi:hypothetical protein
MTRTATSLTMHASHCTIPKDITVPMMLTTSLMLESLNHPFTSETQTQMWILATTQMTMSPSLPRRFPSLFLICPTSRLVLLPLS